MFARFAGVLSVFCFSSLAVLLLAGRPGLAIKEANYLYWLLVIITLILLTKNEKN